jgi:uncharacterized protein YceH (UPF0502 family)
MTSDIPMEFQLDPVEVRVLGSLIEKEITTPEYYPLSLNALVNACNQKSNRDPVMQLDESAVREALSRLEDLNLAGRIHDSRVIKFEHHARQLLDLRRPEIALLCLLLLRGPQTAGELRTRAERLYTFDDVQTVQSVLERMTHPQTNPNEKPRPALVTHLSRRAGEKEPRYVHLLNAVSDQHTTIPELPRTTAPSEQIERMEFRINAIEATVDAILARLEKMETRDRQQDS